jgi:DNA-binding transcriptional LysR family regulator
LVAVTLKGELLAEDARQILRMHESAHDRLSDTSLGGVVRVGMSDDFASGRRFTASLAEFSMRHPNVQLKVEVGNSTELIVSLKAGELDFVLAKRLADDGSGEMLGQHDVHWASAVGIQMPAGPVRLVLFPAPCAYQTLALEALRRQEMPWVVAYISPSFAGIRSALSAGLGISPLARDLISDGLVRVGRDSDLPRLGKIGIFLHEGVGEPSDAKRQLGRLLREHHSAAGDGLLAGGAK